jgi:hypothetical protein
MKGMLEKPGTLGRGVIYMDVETAKKGSEIIACYRVSGERKTELISSATVKIEIEHHTGEIEVD